jgi:uncharacterized membrane protein YgcG
VWTEDKDVDVVVVLGDDRGLTEEEEQGIERLCDGQSSDDSDSGGPSTATRVGVSLGAAAAPGTTTQLHKMNLGPVCNLSQKFRPRSILKMASLPKLALYANRQLIRLRSRVYIMYITQQACLLGSHCIVLVHHYLDMLVHCCPGKLWEGAGEAVAKVSKQRQRRSKRRNKPPPPQEAPQQQGEEEVRVATVGCTVCGEQFSSRNQLFKHIKASDACRDRGGSGSSSSGGGGGGGGGGGHDEEEARTASPSAAASAGIAADGADSGSMLPPSS